MPTTHLVPPGTSIDLQNFDTRAEAFHNDRAAAEAEFKDLRDQFIDLQPRLYAEAKQKLLIVLQAMDAGGKDSTTRKVCKGVNPQGVKVTSFKKPTAEELSHDFLWRIHKAVPAAGMIGIFNRSHYEDVLVVRVHQLVPQEVWQPRYQVINQFEHLLHSSGTRILKFFLHISKQEQKERFQERLDRPEKHWKFDRGDLDKRKLWDEYQIAFADMLTNCSTDYAPWHIIPADQKWYRNLAVTRIIVHTLQEMNPQFPVAEDLSGITIP